MCVCLCIYISIYTCLYVYMSIYLSSYLHCRHCLNVKIFHSIIAVLIRCVLSDASTQMCLTAAVASPHPLSARWCLSCVLLRAPLGFIHTALLLQRRYHLLRFFVRALRCTLRTLGGRFQWNACTRTTFPFVTPCNIAYMTRKIIVGKKIFALVYLDIWDKGR